jgi:hypothetical protein
LAAHGWRRDGRHSGSVKSILGGDGWLARLDEPVAARLNAHDKGYNGQELLELVRAIRNIQEHWFGTSVYAQYTHVCAHG